MKLVLVLPVLWSCSVAAPPPLPAPDAPRYAAALERAGIAAKVELLHDLRETPGCAPAQTRFRLRFGDGEFVNVSRFADPAGARSCWEDYREVVSKGGQVAWDRLAPLAVLEDRHLLLFPDTAVDPARRSVVVDALRAAE